MEDEEGVDKRLKITGRVLSKEAPKLRVLLSLMFGKRLPC